MAAGKYSNIYLEADEQFRANTGEQKIIQFFRGVSERLGDVVRTERTSWRVTHQPGGARVDLTYSTTFTHGAGVESFAFRMISGEPVLLHYNIQLPLSFEDEEPGEASHPGTNEG